MGTEPDNVQRCEIVDYDGSDERGKPCNRPAVTIDSKGRAVCRRHYSKRPEHLKRDRRKSR